MDSPTAYIGDFWWVVVVPAALMVFVWMFRGRGLKVAFLLLFAGIAFIYFSSDRSSGIGAALDQILGSIVQTVRQVGASLL